MVSNDSYVPYRCPRCGKAFMSFEREDQCDMFVRVIEPLHPLVHKVDTENIRLFAVLYG